jgi:hypothetical protein
MDREREALKDELFGICNLLYIARNISLNEKLVKSCLEKIDDIMYKAGRDYNRFDENETQMQFDFMEEL